MNILTIEDVNELEKFYGNAGKIKVNSNLMLNNHELLDKNNNKYHTEVIKDKGIYFVRYTQNYVIRTIPFEFSLKPRFYAFHYKDGNIKCSSFFADVEEAQKRVIDYAFKQNKPYSLLGDIPFSVDFGWNKEMVYMDSGVFSCEDYILISYSYYNNDTEGINRMLISPYKYKNDAFTHMEIEYDGIKKNAKIKTSKKAWLETEDGDIYAWKIFKKDKLEEQLDILTLD